MIGLDTNVVLRLIVDDGGDRPGRAHAFVSARCTPRDPGYVSAVTMVELAWVLQQTFQRSKSQTIAVFETILAMSDLTVDVSVAPSLHDWRSSKADFADHVIAVSGRAAGCGSTATFDKFAAKEPGFTAVP